MNYNNCCDLFIKREYLSTKETLYFELTNIVIFTLSNHITVT